MEKGLLRRAALLLFPKESLNDETLDRIVDEGFTDVGAGVVASPLIGDQGFSFEQAERLAAMCHERGLGFVAFTGYMKYQQRLLAEEPERLMITAGGGVVHDLDGLRVRWLCPFQPANRERYLALLMKVCEWPAVVEVHLNDEASIGFSGGIIGCYCDYCRGEFRAKTGAEPPVSPDWDDPLWYDWIEHRFDNWVDVHAEFRGAIKQMRPDVDVGIQHSPYIPERVYNAWQSGVCLARDARAQDVISTDPYHFNHADGILYRPHRRILAETTRSTVGACIERRVTIYPQGFMPPAQAVPMGRQDGLLAGVVPFALGADMAMPFTYELMKIIPGFFEAFDEARKLLPHLHAHRPYAYATMLCPQQSEIYGHHDTDWGCGDLRRMADMVFRTGLPWRWLWDQRLDDAGDYLHAPLICTEAHCLTAGQIERIESVGGVLRIGNTSRQPWAGHGACPLPAPIEHGAFRMEIESDHPLVADLAAPVILGTRVAAAPPGEVLATVDGEPALVLTGERTAWLSGIPATEYFGAVPGSWSVQATSNVELLRRLITWAAGERPLVRLDPFPPVDDYRTLRPADRRAVPTVELLPMVRPGSILAIVFPYTPVGCETALEIAAPVRKVTELWTEQDWTDRMEEGGEGTFRLPLKLAGDLDLLALHVECAGS